MSSKVASCFILLAFVLLLGGCGDQLFEKIAFRPAQQLALDADACRYFHGEQDCHNTEYEELFFPSLDPEIRLQALFFPHPQSQKLIVYFQGNGGHIYYRIPHFLKLSKIANVFAVSYRGYGKSSGEPSEAGVYQDAIAGLNYAHQQLGFATAQTYVYGRSLGAAVAVAALADRVNDNHYAGLILVSPFYNGQRMAEAAGLAWVPGLNNPFDSASRVRRLKMPVLFIHGTQDRIVPFQQGYDLYQLYPAADKTFKTVEGAGHNRLSSTVGESYWQWIAMHVNSDSNQEP